MKRDVIRTQLKTKEQPVKTKTMALLGALAALTACSISIPVTKVSKDGAAEGEGTLLILPQTSLTLKYNTTEKTFTAGRWTGEVEACEDDTTKLADLRKTAQLANCKENDPAPSTVCKTHWDAANNARAGLKDSCVVIAELDLGSKRFSRPPGANVCTGDGTDSEFRRSFDVKSLAVSAVPVPDPDQVYWVETPARLFGDTEVGMTYTASGTVSGAKSAASNPYVAFAVDVAGIAVQSFIGASFGGGGAAAPAALALARPPKTCRTLLDAKECKALHDELDVLIALYKSEAQLVRGTAANEATQALLAAKKIDIAKTRAKFEGGIETEESAASLSWIPPASDRNRAELAFPEKCINQREKGSAVQNGDCIEHSVCADAGADPFPKQKLSFGARRGKEGAELASVIVPTLNATAVGGEDARKKDRGFPYRAAIQSEVIATVATYASAGSTAPTEKSMPVAQAQVAQFGEVGFLAPRAGGKNGSIEAKYFVDTGALDTLSITGVGADPAPILDPIKNALSPRPELDPMQAEKERLELLQAICVAAADVNEPLPDFCKAPEPD
jgi:hypothetical protein